MASARPCGSFALILCGWLGLAASATKNVLADDLVIINARLFTGSDGRVIEQANIIVSGERIESISTDADDDTLDGRIIDAAGKMVLPGLIDAHVHNFFDFPRFDGADSDSAVYFPKSESEARAYVRGRLQEKLEAYLEQGFTSIASPIDFWPLILDVRQQLASGQLKGPAEAFLPRWAPTPFVRATYGVPSIFRHS